VNDLFNTMIINGYSISQELEADATALSLLASAGYSPGGLLEMMRVLQRVQANQIGGFNSTHPSPAQRISNIERHLSAYRVPDTGSARNERFRHIMSISQ
jgi:predicted Zn-dependent protease